MSAKWPNKVIATLAILGLLTAAFVAHALYEPGRAGAAPPPQAHAIQNRLSTPTPTPTSTTTSTVASVPSPTFVYLPLVTTTSMPPTPTFTPTPAPSPTSTPAPTFTMAAASSGPIYWGAWVPGVPWDMTKQAQFESMTQKGASIMHWGQPWQNGGVFQPFYAGNFDTARNHGSIPMLDWGSWNLGSGVTQSNFQLSDITAGTYDSYITSWATAAKNWGKPLFLRFDWEMNGNWFPWGVLANGNQVGDFVPAWRHVHDIFTSVGATNVSWVWCPNIVNSSTVSYLSALYPGDAYVDWIAIDGYNWAGDRSEPWLSFAQVFQTTYDALVGLAPTKPIMIGETATSDDGGPLGYPNDKANWIGDALKTQLPVNFPKVKALVWFNWNDNNASLDWPIQTSQQAIDAFAQGIRSSYYASNNFAGLLTLP